MAVTTSRLTSGNPALGHRSAEYFAETDVRTMSVLGTAFKTLVLLVFLNSVQTCFSAAGTRCRRL